MPSGPRGFALHIERYASPEEKFTRSYRQQRPIDVRSKQSHAPPTFRTEWLFDFQTQLRNGLAFWRSGVKLPANA